MLGAELGVMKFRLDGGKLEGKRAADARMKCSESPLGKSATSGRDLWEAAEGFPSSLYRQLCYLC